MYEDVFQVSGGPRLSVLSGQGELEIRGWSEPAIKLRGRGGPEDFQVKQEDDAVILHAGEDCLLLVPRDCPVVVERAEDNRTAKVGQEEGLGNNALLPALRRDSCTLDKKEARGEKCWRTRSYRS